MNADLLAARVSYGMGKGASVTGRTYTLYRPDGSGLAPLQDQFRITTLLASMDNGAGLSFRSPSKFGQVAFYGMFDFSNVSAGDYLDGPGGTFFVAEITDTTAPLMVRCSNAISVSAPQSVAGGYMGAITMVPMLTSWPCLIVKGPKGTKTDAGLPGDTRAPWWEIYLPPSMTQPLRFGDIATDDDPQPRQFVLSMVERTPIGFRITAEQAVA